MDRDDLKWSGAEKRVARRAFEAALETVLAETVADFKARAAAVAMPADMWAIEDHLRQRRRAIDGLFDYRYSQLCFVFAQLLHLGHLDEGILSGLSVDKLAVIRAMRDRMGQGPALLDRP